MMVNGYMLILVHTCPQCPIILSSLDQASCIHMMYPLSTHITALNVCPQIHKTLWCPQDYFSRLDWLLQSHGRHCPTLIVRSATLKLMFAIPSTHACICFHFFLWQNIFSECQDYCCQNWCVFQSCMINLIFFLRIHNCTNFCLVLYVDLDSVWSCGNIRHKINVNPKKNIVKRTAAWLISSIAQALQWFGVFYLKKLDV